MEESKTIVTVVTPTYNREKEIVNLYKKFMSTDKPKFPMDGYR